MWRTGTACRVGRVREGVGGGDMLLSRCVSLHHMLEERNDANEDKRSPWAAVLSLTGRWTECNCKFKQAGLKMDFFLKDKYNHRSLSEEKK